MVKYREIWEEICSDVNKYYDSKEEVFQPVVEGWFRTLGYSSSKQEIIKESIRIGSKQHLIPDIKIRVNGENRIVIELKRVDANFTSDNEKQLFSYMRQTKVLFGLLIGNSIQMYYDVPNDQNDPIKVYEIKFTMDDENAITIIKLLSKEGWNFKKLQKFCNDQISKKSYEKEKQGKIDFLCSVDGEMYIRNMLSKNYPEDVLKAITINILKNEYANSNNAIGQEKAIQITDEKLSKSLAIFIFEESGYKFSNKNITFASLNSTQAKYWANPNVNLLSQLWFIILNDTKSKELFLFRIPANTFTPKQFKCRADRPNLIDLNIDYLDIENFTDLSSHIKFKRFLEKKISY